MAIKIIQKKINFYVAFVFVIIFSILFFPSVSNSQVGTVKWEFEVGGWINSNPAIGDDGTIYVGSDDFSIYAINPDGTKKWSYPTENCVRSGPTIGLDGTIYAGSWDQKLYAINPDGTLKWTFPTGSSIDYSPAIARDGTIYFSSQNKLYAVSPNGLEKWIYYPWDDITTAPAVWFDGTIFIGVDTELHAVTATGNRKWVFETNGVVRSSPAIGSDGTVYIGSFDKTFYAINPDGSLKWSFLTDGNIFASSVIDYDETNYISSGDGFLYAINFDGTLKWKFELYKIDVPTVFLSTPTIGINGVIFVGGIQHYLYAINRDGTLNWSYTTNGSVQLSPVLAKDGTVYIDEYKQEMIEGEVKHKFLFTAIQSNSKGIAKTPWPMLGHDPAHTGLFSSLSLNLIDSDGDGVPNQWDECPSTLIGLATGATGCPMDYSPADMSLSLTTGWNLIGLKSNETTSITDLISGKKDNIASVWKWKDGAWAVYLPGEDDGGAAYVQSKGFSVLGDINPGEGFWVNCSAEMTLD